MGNQTLKTAFKGHLKNEVAEEKNFHMNADFLFENNLIDLIYQKVKKEKIVGEFEIEGFLKENNNQVNSHCEDIGVKKLINEIHQNVIAGFSSADANMEYLKESDFEKYFTVYCPEEVTDFTTLQQKKFFILYNLYVEKYKESKKEGAGFFDFVRRFFEEKDPMTDRSEAVQISLQGGLKFSIHLLKEIQTVAPHIVKSSLEYLYENFRSASPLSLYGVDKTFFVSDMSINEARSFLTSILKNPNEKDLKTKEMALKLIMVIGIMRGNVEDLVIALNLIEENKFEFDISEELDRISFDVEETALNPKLFQEIEKVKSDGILFYLQNLLPADKSMRRSFGYTTDGQHLYIHYKGIGLLKIGTGENDKMLGKVYAHKSFYRLNEKCQLLYLNGKLLLRSKQDTSKPLFVIDPETLDETKETVILEKDQPNIEFKDDKDNNRYMNITPLFSESQFLYTISYKKPEKDDEEEEEKEETANQNDQNNAQQQNQSNNQQQQQPNQAQQEKKDKEDNTSFQYTIDVFELQKKDNKLKYIKSIPIMKDKDNPLIKPKLILKRASFVTNGKIMLMLYKRQMHFFDLSTGIRLQKAPLLDELKPEQDGLITYDVLNHRLWYLNRKDKELYSFICPNFKRVVKEESEFQIQYLKRRINAIRNKDLPPTKTVKEKQMDKVLSALGIQPIKSVIKEGGQMPFENATIDENKFLIMSLLADSSSTLERERPQIHWNPKKYEIATKMLLGQFKNPFITNLTPFFFTELSKLLDSFIPLLDQSKTTKTLEQQYSFYFTLKVLKSNLISLTICEIDLKDVIQDEDIYNKFYNSFKNTVVKIIEKGFNKEFQNAEIQLLWKEIYDECLLSMSMGLGMIYNSFQEINMILKNSLADLSHPKNREYALLVITNFARHETIRKLINTEQNLNELFTLFEQIFKIQSDQVLSALNNTTFPDGYQDLTKNDLQQAVSQFIYRFCEKFIVFYTEYKDYQLAQKKYMEKFMVQLFDMLTQQCLTIIEALKSLLIRFYEHIQKQANTKTSKYQEITAKNYCQKVIVEVSNFYSMFSMYVSTFSAMEVDIGVMSPVSNSVVSFIDALCQFFTDVSQIEKKMEKILKPTFIVESSHNPYIYEIQEPVHIHCKGAECFKMTYSKLSKFPPQDFIRAIRFINPNNQNMLLQVTSESSFSSSEKLLVQDSVDVTFEYTDIKKRGLEHIIGFPAMECYGYKFEIVPEFGQEVQSLNDYLDQILRSCTWLIGRFSYSLIRIKKVEKETEEEKNYKLLLHSKIFSGGFENKFLYMFSKRSVKKLQELADITEDKIFLDYFTMSEDSAATQLNDQEKILYSILETGKDEKVEKALFLLQKHFSKSVIWGNVGGKTGEKMVRAAFAPMIKFSNLTTDFHNLCEELQIEDEILASENNLDQKEKDQKLFQIVKQNHKYELIYKRWGIASQMRTFYQELKKSISEALEKKRLKMKMFDQQDYKGAVKEEEKNKEEENQEFQIDTSSLSQKKDLEDNSLVQEEVFLVKSISNEDHEKLERDIDNITQKMIEKSEFLLRLSIPEAWEFSENAQKENDEIVLMRTTSEIAAQKHNLMKGQEEGQHQEDEVENKESQQQQQQQQNAQQQSQTNTKEWKKKLHQWRMMQQSKGVIKSMENAGQNRVFDSVRGSVLACLQSAISLKRLQKQVETVYLNASMRVAGLKLIGKIMNKQIPHVFDLINWFCSSLRGNTNNLTHYLDDIRGCGKLLEGQARTNFFFIIKGLLKKLVTSKNDVEIRQIFNALRWNYSANDHKVLNDLRIFKVLRDGNKESEKLKHLWGTSFKYEFFFKEPAAQGQVKSKAQDRKEDLALLNKTELSKEALDLFEFLLITSLGRSLKPQDESTTIKLKETSKQKLMPTLERIESVMDVDATLQLLSQGYEIIFKELQSFVEFAEKFDGIGWKVYVRLMNRFRKTGQYFKLSDGPNDLLSQPLLNAAAVRDDYYEQDYGQEEQYDYGEEQYEGGEKDGFVDIDKEQEFSEKMKEEIELEKVNGFYNIKFTHRLLQMINLLASVATNNAYASHILFNISHPQRIGTLIGILCNGTPNLKILTIKILEHLINVLPPELFEESVTIMTTGSHQKSYQSQILEKIATQTSLGKNNKFTKLLFSYMLTIRNKIWARKFESQGMYGVSICLCNLLRKMLENSVWRHLHEQELKQAISMITRLPFEEKDAILSLFGGEIQGLSTGVVALDKNENKITILGFSDQWIEDQEDQAKKNLKVPKTTTNFEQKTNKAIGLFINETSIDNNELLILDPQELVLVQPSSKRTNQLPIKDLLMEKDTMMQLISTGILKLSSQKSEYMGIEDLNFKISITKIIYNLIYEREEQFIDFLKQPQMQNTFTEFLNLLFTESCRILKTPITLQLDWVEQKCFEIRKEACESTVTLTKQKDLYSQVVIDKVFFSYNTSQKERVYFDYDLVGALNFDNIVEMQLKVGFFMNNEKLKSPEFLIINGPDLFTPLGLKRFAESEIALTCDLNLEEYQLYLEKQEKSFKGIQEKPLIMIDSEDFKEVNQKYKNNPEFQEELNFKESFEQRVEEELEEQAKILSEWTGLDYKKITNSLKQVDSDFSLASKINSLVKEEQKRIDEEKKKKQEQEEAKKQKKLYQSREEKKEEEKVESKKDKEEVMESNKKEELTEQEEEIKQKEEELKLKQQRKEEKAKIDPKILEKKKKEKEEMEREAMRSLVLDLVQTDTTQNMKFDLKERKKLESQTAEALFKSIKGFSEGTAYNEYQQSLGLLFTLYCRRILQKILTIKFEESLAIMLNSEQRKSQFKQFLKIISNEAIFVKFNTRNKKLISNINELLKRIVIKCQSEAEYKPFIDELFQEDVLKASSELIKHLKNEKVRSIKLQFSSEQKATKYSNPYFVLSISKIFLEQCNEELLKENILPTLIEQFLTLSYLFNKDPELKVKINEFILNILEQVQKSYGKLSFKLKEQLQQMDIFKSIVEKYNFNATATDSVYQRHNLLLLEILMKLLHLKKISKKEIHSIYTKNETILQIQRAKDVLRETTAYKLLMYLIHYNKLSAEQRTIKKNFESSHKMFETKFTAQFRIDEIEKMICLFDENTEIEPDTAVAITRDYQGKEVLQVFFAEEIARKTLDIYDENVFIHCPCKPSTIFAFGDCYNGKLGIDMSQGQFENPTIIKKVLAKVNDIQSYNNALVIQLEDGTLYRGGYKEYWNQNDKHQMKKWDKKVQNFSLGFRHCMIIDEKGNVQGEGVSNGGGMGTEVYENKNWLTIKMPNKEKIVSLSAGYDFSFAVSDQGSLFCTGNNMLSKLNIPNLNKFEKIDLGQTVKVEKVVSGYSVCALLLVKNSGVNELWSAGYNSKGALGSGDNTQNKNVFGRLAYDASSIKFVDMDIYQDHAAALTEDGELYQWGSNAFGRCGIRDRDKNTFQPQFWEPKKVEYFNEYIVRQVACGSCHTILIASPKKDPTKKQVFAYGREDANGHHLACSNIEAAKDDEFIKHIKRFDHLKVYKVEAGAKCSFVCCEGEEELLTGRYYHSYAKCENCQVSPVEGPLHFIPLQRNDSSSLESTQQESQQKFKFWCSSCARNKPELLPKLCYAIKAQINDIENKTWPNLEELEKNLEEGVKEFTCDFLKQRMSTQKCSLYMSFTKLTETIDEFNLCEDSYYQANNNDVNPIIYLRIQQGYKPKQLESFPTFELNKYYPVSDYYGLRFSLSPDFQYTINQQILQETSEQYNNFNEEMKKFDGKFDEELYKFVEDFCYQNREVALKDINPNVIDIDERRFTDKLKKVNLFNQISLQMPDALKRKRLHLLLEFNKYAAQLIPFIDFNTKLSLEASARLNAFFMKSKEFIMYGVKYKYQAAYVNNLEVSADKKDININRMRAARFFESGKVDHTGEYTVFGQVFKPLYAKKFHPLMINNSTDRAWNSKFIGEGSIDVGGPYRETIHEMCKELQSHVLPLLIPTQNQKNDFGEHRDKWIPCPSATSPSHIAMFEFLGALVGMSIRCSQILNLNFPSMFWKMLIDEPLDRSDLNMLDTYCVQMLDGIKNLAMTLPEKEFQEYHDQKFVTCLSDGTEIELVPGGKNKILTKENALDYISMVSEARLNEFSKQMKAIKKGIGMVFPPFLMKMYTWKELEYKVCGKPSIDLVHLRAITKYNGCSEEDDTVKRFWRVLESFTDEEKSLYLKFVWGRSRLPLVDEKFGDKHTIKLITPNNCDQSLPIAHTCFFAIDIPKYSTEDIMKEKFLYAIKFCQAIDTDGSPYEILGEQDDDF